MRDITRLAVIDRGESAVRMITAVNDITRRPDSTPVVAVVVHDEPSLPVWYAREADETIALPWDRVVTPDEVVAALVAAGIDMAWVGRCPCAAERASLIAACEAAGIGVVGPSSGTIARVLDPAGLRALAEIAGVEMFPGEAPGVAGRPAYQELPGPPAPGAPNPAGPDARDLRRIEIEVIRDDAGTAWTLGLRDASVRRGPHLVFAELPAPGVPAETAAAMSDAARRLLEAADYSGAGVVDFLLDHDASRFWLLSIDPEVRPDHAMFAESTAVSFMELRIDLARGALLTGPSPETTGHAVEVRVLAEDPERGSAPSGGRVRLLALPTGTGVRLDASLREGDVVEAGRDPLIALLTATGRDRAHALQRLRIAVERTVVALEDGVTNRSMLLGLLRAREKAGQFVTISWYDELVASGALVPDPDPVALIAAAVETYEADLAMVRAAFVASASRGRPEIPEEVGLRMHLSYRGVDYWLRVDHTGADRYQVRSGAESIEVRLEWLGPLERRLVVAGRKRRIVVVEQRGAYRLEVDGVAHTVTREDGVAVRTDRPALVQDISVVVGEHVEVGQHVATLESMKLVSSLTSPVTGTVTALDVTANTQVERGASVVRIRPDDGDPAPEASPVTVEAAPAQQVTFAALDAAPAAPVRSSSATFATLRDYLLGFDLDPAVLDAVLAEQRRLSAAATSRDTDLVARENEFIELFAELAALYRPRSGAEVNADPGLADQVNTQEYVLAFLQWLDADLAGLPQGYRVRLEAALHRYGVTGLRRTPELESAVLWMYRSFSRVPELVPVVADILERRVKHADALELITGPGDQERLEHLATATEGRYQVIAELARNVSFRLFEAPVLHASLAGAAAEMRTHLAALRADPQRADRADRIDRLVWGPQPLRGLLLGAWRHTAGDGSEEDEAYRSALLTILLRRFYRIRELRAVDDETVISTPGSGAEPESGSGAEPETATGSGSGSGSGSGTASQQVAFATYRVGRETYHPVVGYTPLDDLPAYSRAIAPHLRAVPADQHVTVDLMCWRDTERTSIDRLAADVAALLEACDFGRALRRLDITVTSLRGGGRERGRTQHLTYRQTGTVPMAEVGEVGPDAPFVEDRDYRNLHPMLAKRIDMWRYQHFTLERLPAAEDIYLFSGVAKSNPQDHRLFALAEVRDLTPAHHEETGEVTYPQLIRTGLEALAAMRSALSRYPQRARPAANRLVITVRPTWTVPKDALIRLAEQYRMLALGVGLDRLVLHIQWPDPDRDDLPVEKILLLRAMPTGVTVHMTDPGPNPVRPLTPYAQKVLTAARFGVPYPYEIVQTLTPSEGDSSPFPPGSFQELDLDGAGGLVPVDRPPGENTAHIVVGLLTSYTARYPEGMTRIALLSDPTQGLGNLSEPECRRINAALDHATSAGLPVEWYAVSSGALISMDSGTENMDWIALSLRRIAQFAQAGGELNVIITGMNVGGQPYWNATATMLMGCRGVLIMTPASTMVLSGKQALDISGAVSAEDNHGIGGYDRVMGPNGQAQYWAPTFEDACALLLRHYELTYVAPGERFPRRYPTSDPVDRDVRTAPHEQVQDSPFTQVGEIWDPARNAQRKLPFDMRSVMAAIADTDVEPLERWKDWRDAESAIVWDTCIGGVPVCLLGVESHRLPRTGFVPTYGPPEWTSGTLFPQASRKLARAINATGGRRPLVVLANLSGFDGSPESMRYWQLEYGAEIGRAVANTDGPIILFVVSRYHGGSFVVFSKRLNDGMEVAAVEGSFASVIGGAPAAATVFAREVRRRTEGDVRVRDARKALADFKGDEAGPLRADLVQVAAAVQAEKLREVADEYDAIHTIERAQRVGSVDRIVSPERIRPYLIDALERGMARFTDRP